MVKLVSSAPGSEDSRSGAGRQEQAGIRGSPLLIELDADHTGWNRRAQASPSIGHRPEKLILRPELRQESPLVLEGEREAIALQAMAGASRQDRLPACALQRLQDRVAAGFIESEKRIEDPLD